MQVPRLIAPGLTFGAALSNSTPERPYSSLPVTTRRIGRGSDVSASPPRIDILPALLSRPIRLRCFVIHRRAPIMHQESQKSTAGEHELPGARWRTGWGDYEWCCRSASLFAR